MVGKKSVEFDNELRDVKRLQKEPEIRIKKLETKSGYSVEGEPLGM